MFQTMSNRLSKMHELPKMIRCNRMPSLSIGIAAVAAVLAVLFLVGRFGLVRRNETFLNKATAACKEGRYEDAARLLGLIRSHPFFLVSRGDTVSKSLEEHVKDALEGHMQLKGESTRMSVEVGDIVGWLSRNGYTALAGVITNDVRAGEAACAIGDYKTANAKFSAVTNMLAKGIEAVEDECENAMRHAMDCGAQKLARDKWERAENLMAWGDEALEKCAYTNALSLFGRGRDMYMQAAEAAANATLAALRDAANEVGEVAGACVSNLIAMGAGAQDGDAFNAIMGGYASGTNFLAGAQYGKAIEAFRGVTNDCVSCANRIANNKFARCSSAKGIADKAVAELRDADGMVYAKDEFGKTLGMYASGTNAFSVGRYDEALRCFELVAKGAAGCLSKIEAGKKRHKHALSEWNDASASIAKVRNAIGDNLNCDRWREAGELFKRGDLRFKAGDWDAAAEAFRKAKSRLEEMFTRGTAFPKRPRHLQTFTLELPEGAEIEMIYVGPGKFEMGCDVKQAPQLSLHGDIDYNPAHRIALRRGFWLGKYEVTQKQWRSVMKSDNSRFKGADLPAECVSWNDCQRFIRKVNELPLQNCEARLPTEAEWEYACRAGTTGAYALRDVDAYVAVNKTTVAALETMGWYRLDSNNMTHKCGEKNGNPWGFYDMHGNVWEWCNDWYQGDYYKVCWPLEDPQGPKRGVDRVLRGGGYSSDAQSCRSFVRHRQVPDYKRDDCGFRLCCSARPRE